MIKAIQGTKELVGYSRVQAIIGELESEITAGIAALGLETPVTGRVFVIISRNENREPREEVGINGVPFWGLDVSNLSKTAQGIVDRLAGDLSLMTHGCSYQEYHRRMKCLHDNLQRKFMDPNLGRINP